MVSIATYDPSGDPSTGQDSFAMLTSIVTREKILLTDAVSWNKKKFPDLTFSYIEEKIAAFDRQFKFDFHLCEKNNSGSHVIHSLTTKYKIPVIPINTSNHLKKEATLRKIYEITNNKAKHNQASIDKDKAVAWIERFRQDGIIEFPATLTPGLRDMKEQLDHFGRKPGKTKYEALVGHDDYVTCLIILTEFAKAKFLKLTAKDWVTLLDSELGGDPVTVLNKEQEEGKTGIQWKRRT